MRTESQKNTEKNGILTEMNDYIPERVKRMSEYVPDTSSPRVKLDANECPYPLPEDAKAAMLAALTPESLNRYPDPDMKDMLSAYGKYISVSPEQLVAGDGSDELINLIINTFLCEGGKIVLCLPDFSMYKFYSELAGVDTVVYAKQDGMRIDFEELYGLVKREKANLVMFSNPCNPTSVLESREAILDFIGKTDALVVVDEAYMEFARQERSVLDKINEYDNLIVLKTLSKVGLAGLRCGFAASSPHLIAALKKTKSPYNMNTVTQAAVSAILGSFDGVRENIKRIKQGARRLYDGVIALADRGGFALEMSDTNFIYIRFSDKGKAVTLQKELHVRGISVRCMNGCLRVTAGTEEENEEFIKAFSELIG